MTKQLFGTDGIRGLPGEFPLDDATLDRVGMALGEYVSAHGRTPRDRPRVLIGRDTRESRVGWLRPESNQFPPGF
jgi:phosphoglucosamine mutase